MKVIIYALILPLVLVSGLVFGFTQSTLGINSEIETSKKSVQRPLTTAEMKTELKKWEATPDGILFKEWEESPAGKKVYAAEAKIRKHINDFTNMEGVVTNLSLPPGSRIGFGMMVRINGDDYILKFAPEKPSKNSYNLSNEFELLRNLKVNDKIIIRSHGVVHAPKYFYPMVAADYVERDGKVIYKRAVRKGGC